MKRKTLPTREELINYYNMTEYQADEAIRMMPAVKCALKRNGIYAKVETVSRSGMSRTISLYIVHKGKIYGLNWAFGRIYGDVSKDHGRTVRIDGCGMDMLFEANYRLFKALCPNTPYQDYCRYSSL